MDALKTILRELVGLFVDDVGFAAAIVGWIILAWLLSPFVLPPSPWGAILLFAGPCAILRKHPPARGGTPMNLERSAKTSRPRRSPMARRSLCNRPRSARAGPAAASSW